MANIFRVMRMARVIFDTASTDSSGVANTTIAAHGTGVYIPSGAIITKAFYRVNTTFTTAGADAGTLAIMVNAANDLVSTMAVSTAGDIWDAGIKGCLPGAYLERTVAGDTAILDAASQAASYILTTALREVVVTVATQVLTAGKFTLFIEYVV